MNEESIQASGAPDPGWGDLPAKARTKARRVLRLTGRLLKRGSPRAKDRPDDAPTPSPEPTTDTSTTAQTPPSSTQTPEPSPELLGRARAEVAHYLLDNSALIDRAARFGDRARRLDEEGTPSEISSRRAERAREEISQSLASRREDFVAADGGGREAARAFDAELESLAPELHRILPAPDTP